MIDLFETASELQFFCDRAWFCGARTHACRVHTRVNASTSRDEKCRHEWRHGTSKSGVRASLVGYQRWGEPRVGALPFEENLVRRATPFSFGPSVEIQTCSAEDLIVLKLFASRPLDIRDAEAVEEQLRPLAEVKNQPEILQTLACLREL